MFNENQNLTNLMGDEPICNVIEHPFKTRTLVKFIIKLNGYANHHWTKELCCESKYFNKPPFLYVINNNPQMYTVIKWKHVYTIENDLYIEIKTGAKTDLCKNLYKTFYGCCSDDIVVTHHEMGGRLFSVKIIKIIKM